MARLVVDEYRGGYAEGFSRDKVYQFSRVDGEPCFVGKLSDCNPFFNVAGLLFSELPDELTASQ